MEFKLGLEIVIVFEFVDLEGHCNQEKNRNKCSEKEDMVIMYHDSKESMSWPLTLDEDTHPSDKP